MKLLLDTHVALWIVRGDEQLSERAGQALRDPANSVLLSAVIVWEVAIKRGMNKLSAPEGFARPLLRAGARALPISLRHAEMVEHLPWHHRDPFDRLLVAQAHAEEATILTGDAQIDRYDVPVLW